jgi:tRNA-dihydrouridine synthase
MVYNAGCDPVMVCRRAMGEKFLIAIVQVAFVTAYIYDRASVLKKLGLRWDKKKEPWGECKSVTVEARHGCSIRFGCDCWEL